MYQYETFLCTFVRVGSNPTGVSDSFYRSSRREYDARGAIKTDEYVGSVARIRYFQGRSTRRQDAGGFGILVFFARAHPSSFVMIPRGAAHVRRTHRRRHRHRAPSGVGERERQSRCIVAVRDRRYPWSSSSIVVVVTARI